MLDLIAAVFSQPILTKESKTEVVKRPLRLSMDELGTPLLLMGNLWRQQQM